ncbi:uncharacterized protein LOC133838295 [Drosophila sulfurigaster albostrigata]|uniref:uncharacterized protein LOC133838295 n=1 Tax=Drosophila sulfurigaster albostrigata TaxID=89887 RepID=UPI002D21E76A|nr:uncharacterized protein LOC133838295 [Drosophila sulfurigaster albostrigata]
MSLFPHKSWHQSESEAVTRMQIFNTTRAQREKKERNTMSSLGQQRGRGSSRNICWLAMLLLLMLVPDFIVALKDVSVMIPQAVKRGSNALFTCNYDMENDTLYSVKWYKGKREFYRYTPKENPAMKVFAMTSGLNVERNLSNQSHVVLQSVPLNISGKFTCEISVEAPTFQTAMVSGEMEVVELPEEHTVVTGIQARYRIGDLVDGNCSIKYSKPAANLTWTINGIVVPPHHIKTYQTEKQENTTLESVTSAIHFMVTNQHFLKGQMRLKCTANIFDIFKEEIESIIEEDKPRIMASGRSYDMNNYPLDEHGNSIGERDRGRGYEDHNESYLTYYSPEDSASGASKAAHEIFWRFWLLKLTEMLSVEHIKKLHRHFNRQLVKWAWLSKSVGCLAALAMPLWLWGAHQIISCQYGSDKAAAQQQQHQTNDSRGNDRKTSDKVATVDCNVTMSKAPATAATAAAATGGGDKCFYNCQMALAALSNRDQQQHSDNLQEAAQLHRDDYDSDVHDDDADDDDDDANDDNFDGADGGNIASVTNASDDLTAAAITKAAALKRHQQLSATLAQVGVAATLDQRLLMTWQELATPASTSSC